MTARDLWVVASASKRADGVAGLIDVTRADACAMLRAFSDTCCRCSTARKRGCDSRVCGCRPRWSLQTISGRCAD